MTASDSRPPVLDDADARRLLWAIRAVRSLRGSASTAVTPFDLLPDQDG